MHLRRRLTFANICSASALAIALGVGSANAASLIDTAQLHNGAVTTKKLAPHAVTGSRVKPHSLSAKAFAPGALRRSVIVVPYTAELATGSTSATLTYPVPAGSWLVTTTAAIVSAGGPTGNLPSVRCEGPQDRNGFTPHVLINTNDDSWGNAWSVTSPVKSTGASPETTIWTCNLFGSSSANLKVTTLLQRVGGFE